MKTIFKFISVVVALIILGTGMYEYIQSQTTSPPVTFGNAELTTCINFNRENYSGMNNATFTILNKCPEGRKFQIGEFLIRFVFIGSTTKQVENNITTSGKQCPNNCYENQQLKYRNVTFESIICYSLSFSYRHPERNITWNFSSPRNTSKVLPAGYYTLFEVGISNNNFFYGAERPVPLISLKYPYVYIPVSYFKNKSNPQYVKTHYENKDHHISSFVSSIVSLKDPHGIETSEARRM